MGLSVKQPFQTPMARRGHAPYRTVVGGGLSTSDPRNAPPKLVNFRSMSIASDLRERLAELRSRLNVLLVRRERASGMHSFARARQDMGVTHHDAETMAQFAEDEVAGDAEMTNLRREIVSVGDELERDQGSGLRARAGRALRSKRR
jgi:hypothetical protein